MSCFPIRLCTILFLVLSFFPSALFACDVPVFSYAMQHWSAAPYRVDIFYKGALLLEAKRLSDAFKAAADHDGLDMNLEVNVFDAFLLTDATLQELHRNYLADVDTGVLIQYPISANKEQPIYAGPLTNSLLRELVDSPARKALVSNLLAGNVAVWVLLESGNLQADKAAATILQQELRRLEGVLELPETELWAWSDELGETLRAKPGVHLPILSVSRDAPEEQLFIQMLLNSESDLLKIKDRPIVFPIFGRGLVLYALVGTGINEWTIADACNFIIGPCSCQAKASNPGTDLLLNVDWEQYMGRTRYDEPVSLINFSDFFEGGKTAEEHIEATASQNKEIAAGEITKGTESVMQSGSFLRYVFFAGILIVGIIVAAYLSYKQITAKEPN